EPARLAHRLTEAREAVSAIADEPRAKKRGELRGRPFGGERQAVALVGEHLLGVTAVPRVPGEARPLAQILAARAAIEAFAAGEGEPRHPHAIADAELAGGAVARLHLRRMPATAPPRDRRCGTRWPPGRAPRRCRRSRGPESPERELPAARHRGDAGPCGRRHRPAP